MFKQIDDISQLEDNGLLIFEVLFASVFLLIIILRYFYMRKVGTMHSSTVPVHPFTNSLRNLFTYRCILSDFTSLSGLAAFLFKQGIVDGPMQNIAIGIHEFTATSSYVLIAARFGSLYSRQGEGMVIYGAYSKEEGPSENEYVKKISEFENNLRKNFYNLEF